MTAASTNKSRRFKDVALVDPATGTSYNAASPLPVLLPAGAALIGKVGIDQTTPGTTNGVTETVSSAAGGVATTHRLLSAAGTTNGTSVKASAGRIYLIHGRNNNAATRFLKLYNKASAPTVGTDTPVKTIEIPGNSSFSIDWDDIGYYFATGIAYAWTTAAADADVGALTAADITSFNIDYA